MRRLSVYCLRLGCAAVLFGVGLVRQSVAWGGEGHGMINRLAGETLPADVPEFLRSPAALDALVYYGPEPDRWRSLAEPELNAAQAPEHFIDLEYADLAGPLPRRRYDFVRALAAAQAAHPEVQLTPEKIGLQPYETVELYERLKSALRDYRALAAAKKDTKPSEAEIVFLAGWLGHYVADGSMPLHTSIQYNGWTGPNPNGYTTEHHIHALFESDFVHAAVRPGDVAPLVRATKPVVMGDVFDAYMKYLRHSNTLVERTYELEKAGGFAGVGTPAGKEFVDERLAAGAVELRDMIYTAWVKSGDPVPAYKGN
ncbi:MAG: nuclease [Acidobacteriota bacterium]|nr:nuclease [Acidobacteriota bacterium]